MIAPEAIKWNELTTVDWPDGKTFSGGLYVDYCETVSPWISRRLALEYMRAEGRGGRFQELSLPDLDVDYAAMYYNSVGFPVLIMQKGNMVIHALFYTTKSTVDFSLDDWTRINCELLGNKPNITVK